MTILFGPSQDPETVTMVDSIKIYGKTKDSFGWPEENDESVPASTSGAVQPVNNSNSEGDHHTGTVTQLTKIEK